jgi:hypothetical protein
MSRILLGSGGENTMRALILASFMIGFAGTCWGQMTPHYDSYATYSSDSNNNFYQTIVVEGATTGSCFYTCGPNNQQ